MADIIVKNLKKSFGDKIVLKDINLKISEGEVVSVVGVSGSGKSTLLKVLTGIIDKYEGDIFYGDENINHMPMKDRKFIMMFQNLELFSHLNVYDNVSFGLKMRNEDKKKIDFLVKKYLKLVNLSGYENYYPSELSGGEKQRVALIRSLIVEPRLLLLDEPFSSLDEDLRASVRREIFKIIRNLKIKTLFVTHDMKEATEVSDKIAVLIDGKFLAYNSPKELYDNPGNVKVARFLYKNNIFDDILIKPQDISIVDGKDYIIIDKLFHGTDYEYILRGEREYVVRDFVDRNISDRVGVKIKNYIKLEDEWKN